MDTDPIALVSTLIEAGSIDTVYRDLYLGRAQTLLSPLISLEDFHRLEQQQAALAELPLAVARALEKGDWPLVKELSQRADAVKQVVTSEAKRLATARGVYAVTDVQLDPFATACRNSPGSRRGTCRRSGAGSSKSSRRSSSRMCRGEISTRDDGPLSRRVLRSTGRRRRLAGLPAHRPTAFGRPPHRRCRPAT